MNESREFIALRLIIFCVFSIPVVIYDLKYCKIPVFFCYLGFIILFIFDLIFYRESVLYNSAGAVSIFLLFFLIKKISENGLGNGDLKYSIMCGYFSGVFYIHCSMLIASLSAVIFFLLVKKKKIPFGPFMFAGCFSTKLFLVLNLKAQVSI